MICRIRNKILLLMKICIFTADIDITSGGPSRSVPILSKGLSLCGVSTTLFTCLTSKMNTHLIDGSQVELKVVPHNIKYNELEAEIVKGSYDLIHVQNLWLLLYHKVVRICQEHNIPYIMTPRGCLEPWAYQGQSSMRNLKKKIAMILYQKRDLQKAECILATAKMEADNLRKLGIRAPIAVIPNGIDVSEYKCRSFKHKTLVKKQILYLSRIHRKKGIEYLINAWVLLKDRYPEWKVIIAGNGNEAYIEQLKNKIYINGLQDSVFVVPPVFGASKYELYCESSLFVLP